jgi:phage shock protein A
MTIVSRIRNLVRGLAARWIGARERRHPAAVYEAAIQERLVRYGKLREAAAGVLYLRQKLERELARRTSELAQIRRHLDAAVANDDDEAALALIARRDALTDEVAHAEAELRELTAEAEAAKQNLITFQDEIVRLREERVRMLARLANAKARLRFHETLRGLAPEADIQALESVREHVQRLAAEVELVREGADPALERRLRGIRDAEAQAAARAQLEELKRARREGLDGQAVLVGAS